MADIRCKKKTGSNSTSGGKCSIFFVKNRNQIKFAPTKRAARLFKGCKGKRCHYNNFLTLSGRMKTTRLKGSQVLLSGQWWFTMIRVKRAVLPVGWCGKKCDMKINTFLNNKRLFHIKEQLNTGTFTSLLPTGLQQLNDCNRLSDWPVSKKKKTQEKATGPTARHYIYQTEDPPTSRTQTPHQPEHVLIFPPNATPNSCFVITHRSWSDKQQTGKLRNVLKGHKICLQAAKREQNT